MEWRTRGGEKERERKKQRNYARLQRKTHRGNEMIFDENFSLHAPRIWNEKRGDILKRRR